MDKYQFYGQSEQGIRDENQDAFIVFKNTYDCIVAAVADGMGGHEGGKIAATLTIKQIEEIFKEKDFNKLSDQEIQNFLVESIRKIQKVLLEHAVKEKINLNMGTTLNLNLFCVNRLFTLNIGDSRATQIIDGQLYQISDDHNLATLAERNENFAKYKNFTNFLTSALGPRQEAQLDIFLTTLKGSGYILLTSDGIHNFIDSTKLLKILKRNSLIKDKAKLIIQMSDKNNSTDNMTCVLIYYDFN